jgi:hypothetical protein
MICDSIQAWLVRKPDNSFIPGLEGIKMLRSARLLAIAMIAVGFLMVCNASEAKAQIRVQIGGFGLNGGGLRSVYRGGHRFYSNRTYNYAQRSNYGHSYGHHTNYTPRFQSYGHYGGYGFYHDTTHLDYHAPQVYRHRNHLHYQPGHFDIHRTGHYHH